MNTNELEQQHKKLMIVLDMVEKEALEQAVISHQIMDNIKKLEALKQDK